MDVLPPLVAAVSTLTTAIFLVLWVLERRKHRRFRLNIQTKLSAHSDNEMTILRLSQALNFRHGGIGHALIAFRRCVDSLHDWVPELLADSDMARDLIRVDRFLQHLLESELVKSSQSRLVDSTSMHTTSALSSKSQ